MRLSVKWLASGEHWKRHDSSPRERFHNNISMTGKETISLLWSARRRTGVRGEVGDDELTFLTIRTMCYSTAQSEKMRLSNSEFKRVRLDWAYFRDLRQFKGPWDLGLHFNDENLYSFPFKGTCMYSRLPVIRYSRRFILNYTRVRRGQSEGPRTEGTREWKNCLNNERKTRYGATVEPIFCHVFLVIYKTKLSVWDIIRLKTQNIKH